MAALGGHELGQHGKELRLIAAIAPAVPVPPEMKAAGARGHPDLARGAMAVDDDFRAVGKLHLEHAPFLELEIGVYAACFERALDTFQRLS